jgi:photosystem II stability/assembly factor-like uncharacterized protein
MKNIRILQLLLSAALLAGLMPGYSQALRVINTGGKEITNAIHFPARNTGYLAGGGGTVLKTADGGETWQSVSDGQKHHYVAVQFFGPQHGYLLTNQGELVQTTNGGQQWKPVKDTAAVRKSPAATPTGATGPQTRKDSLGLSKPRPPRHLALQANAMHFFNQKEGVVAGNLVSLRDRKQWGVLLKTANGGLTWDTLYRKEGAVFSAVAFPTRNAGYILSSGGQVLRTGNGGTSWQAVQAVQGHGLRGVYFLNANTGYVVGGSGKGVLLKTTNGGLTWQPQPLSSPNFLQTVYFKNEKTGYVGGGQGSLLKTTDGGTTWTRVATTDREVLKVVFVTDAGKVIAAGSRNKILKEK